MVLPTSFAGRPLHLFLLIAAVALLHQQHGIKTVADAASCSPIVNYVGTNIVSSGPILIDSAFLSSMQLIDSLAGTAGVQVVVTSSLRRSGAAVDGAIVTPAQRSNHLVGHAIDMNVKSGGTLCNSNCLAQSSATLPTPIKNFINSLSSNGLRWGGNFVPKDSVHIDDGYNSNANSYNSRFQTVQSAIQDLCSGKCTQLKQPAAVCNGFKTAVSTVSLSSESFDAATWQADLNAIVGATPDQDEYTFLQVDPSPCTNTTAINCTFVSVEMDDVVANNFKSMWQADKALFASNLSIVDLYVEPDAALSSFATPKVLPGIFVGVAAVISTVAVAVTTWCN